MHKQMDVQAEMDLPCPNLLYCCCSLLDMHLEGNCTTQDTCAYIVYIANDVGPKGSCRIHNRVLVM